jgi:hypothetical protein
MAVRIRSSMEADRYVRECGGRLYVWLAPFGGFTRLTVSTRPPRGEVDLELVHGGGFELLLDRGLERPKVVEVSLRRWPWRLVRVRGLRYRPGGAASEEVDPLEHVIWDNLGGGGGDGGGGGNGGGA